MERPKSPSLPSSQKTDDDDNAIDDQLDKAKGDQSSPKKASRKIKFISKAGHDNHSQSIGEPSTEKDAASDAKSIKSSTSSKSGIRRTISYLIKRKITKTDRDDVTKFISKAGHDNHSQSIGEPSTEKDAASDAKSIKSSTSSKSGIRRTISYLTKRKITKADRDDVTKRKENVSKGLDKFL
jgi:hypothetical protein